MTGNDMTPTDGPRAPTPRPIGRPLKFTPEKIQQIRNLCERGKTPGEIADLLNTTLGTLKVMCSRHGISLSRGITSRPMRKKPMTDNNNDGDGGTGEQPRSAPEHTIRTSDETEFGMAVQMTYKGKQQTRPIPIGDKEYMHLLMLAEERGLTLGELIAGFIKVSLNEEND